MNKAMIIKDSVLVTFAVSGSFLARSLGGWDTALRTLIILMAIDYITNIGITGMLTPVTEHMRESIAISHTVFNVGNTLLWLPLVWLMVKIVRLIVPGEDPIVHKKLAYISYKVLGTPAIAIDLAVKKLVRMTEIHQQVTAKSALNTTATRSVLVRMKASRRYI